MNYIKNRLVYVVYPSVCGGLTKMFFSIVIKMKFGNTKTKSLHIYF